MGSRRPAAEHPRSSRAGAPSRRLSGSGKHSSTAASRPPSRGPPWARPSARQGVADRQGFPIAVHVESATPHEVTLVCATLAARFVRSLPRRLIGDTAYESYQLDAELARRGVALIAPHRRTRIHRTQDGRPLRRYGGGERSNGSLPGFRTSDDSWCGMSDSPRTFLGCYTSPAASSCCEVYEMASSPVG